jgi:hypothetical protein
MQINDFLVTLISEEDKAFLFYLALVLDCDIPILEAYWHARGRAGVKREPGTQSFRNQSFLYLLRDKCRQQLKLTHPNWIAMLVNKKVHPVGLWGLFTGQSGLQEIHYVMVRTTENKNTMGIELSASTRKLVEDTPSFRATFTVLWNVNESLIGISSDFTTDWQTVAPALFLQTLDQQLARISKVFA